MSAQDQIRRWAIEAAAFFDERGGEIAEAPTLEDLCYISGRDPRLWTDPSLYQDMVDHLLLLARCDKSSKLLEVGCAAGFLAMGLAPRVAVYAGVDVAKEPLRVARRLALPNASFRVSGNERLPFSDNTFDAVICCDVITDFPSFETVEPVVREMARVVKSRDGRIVVGSIPDARREVEYVTRVREVSEELERIFGPLQPRDRKVKGARSLMMRLLRRMQEIRPQIVCYYFQANDFSRLGRELGLKTDIVDMHSKNPYAGYRFNVVYST